MGCGLSHDNNRPQPQSLYGAPMTPPTDCTSGPGINSPGANPLSPSAAVVDVREDSPAAAAAAASRPGSGGSPSREHSPRRRVSHSTEAESVEYHSPILPLNPPKTLSRQESLRVVSVGQPSTRGHSPSSPESSPRGGESRSRRNSRSSNHAAAATAAAATAPPAPPVPIPVPVSPPVHPMWTYYQEEQRERGLLAWDHVQLTMWVFDVGPRRMVFGNAKARRFFNCETMEDLMRRDFSNDSQSTKEYCWNCIRCFSSGERTSFYSPWTFYPNGKPKEGAMVTTPYTMRNGTICMQCTLIEEVGSSGVNDLRRAMEAFNRASSMITGYDKLGEPVLQNWKSEEVLGKWKDASNTTNTTAAPTDPATTTSPAPAAAAAMKEKTPSFLPHVTDRAAAAEVLSQLEEGKNVQRKLEVGVKADGGTQQQRWHLVHATRIRDPTNGDPFTVVTEDDVTELDRLANLAQALVEKISVMDLDKADELLAQYSEGRPAAEDQSGNGALRSFVRLISKLKEYRPYLPATLFLHDEETTDEPTSASSTTPPPPQQQQQAAHQAALVSQGSSQLARTRSARAGSRASISSAGSSNPPISPSHRSVVVVEKTNLKTGLQCRKVTMIYVNLLGFEQYAWSNTFASLEGFLDAYVTVVEQAVVQNKGALHLFNGDHCTASWNATQPLMTHANHACICALQIATNLAKLAKRTGALLRLSIAIATGQQIVGNAGSRTSKSFHLVGPLHRQLHAVERFNSQRLHCTTVVSQETYRDAHYAYLFRPVDVVSVDGADRLILYELLGASAGTNDEWMYELHSAQEMEQQSDYRLAFDRLIAGDSLSAAAALERHLREFPDDAHAHRVLEACTTVSPVPEAYCVKLNTLSVPPRDDASFLFC